MSLERSSTRKILALWAGLSVLEWRQHQLWMMRERRMQLTDDSPAGGRLSKWAAGLAGGQEARRE